MNPYIVKRKIRRRLPPYFRFSLLTEGLAVGALVHGGICLMGAHQDLVQRAVVLGVAVVGTRLDGAGDTLVCFAVHRSFLL